MITFHNTLCILYHTYAFTCKKNAKKYQQVITQGSLPQNRLVLNRAFLARDLVSSLLRSRQKREMGIPSVEYHLAVSFF